MSNSSQPASGYRTLLDFYVAQLAETNGWAAKHGTPASGTGIMPAFGYMGTHHDDIPKDILDTINPIFRDEFSSLPGVLGGYPMDFYGSDTYIISGRDQIGNPVMYAVFICLFVGGLALWIKNTTRGHHFGWTLGILGFCVLKIIGFVARNIAATLKIDIMWSIVSIVFIHFPQVILLAMNQTFAHRILTWRRPETANSKIITGVIYSTYFMAVPILVLGIVGQILPYVYILTPHAAAMCRNANIAGVIFNLLYACVPLGILLAALALKKSPTEPPVHRPDWIKNAHTGYYVSKGSQRAPPDVQNGVSYTRIIHTRESPDGNSEYGPRVAIAVMVVIFSSLVLLLCTCMRAAAVFGTYYGNHPVAIPIPRGEDEYGGVTFYTLPYFPFNALCIWIFYGACEQVVILVCFFARVDLRFYIPDLRIRSQQQQQQQQQPETKSELETVSV